MNASTKKIALIVGIVLGATFVITGTYMIAESGKTTDIEKSANVESPVDDIQSSQVIDTLDTSTSSSGEEKLKSDPDVAAEEEKAKDDVVDVVDVEPDVEADGKSKDDLVADGAKDTAGSDHDDYYDENPYSLWNILLGDY